MSGKNSEGNDSLLRRIMQSEPGIQAEVVTLAFASETINSLQLKSPSQLVDSGAGLNLAQARRLKGRLDVAMAAMMRAFRERRSTTFTRRAADELKGLLSLSDGPTYENQFSPAWGTHTRPDALDATTSPVAYLIDMLLFLEDYVETQGDLVKTVALAARRPDIWAIALDEQAMNRLVSQVELVIGILERLVDEHDGQASVEDKLLQVRYPLQRFPYETYWEQISTVLQHNQLLFSDVTRLSDLQDPYFIQAGAHSYWSDVALQQDSELGPALRALLIEPAYFSERPGMRFDPRSRKLLAVTAKTAKQRQLRAAADSVDFFKVNFGVDGHHTLLNVVSFCQVLQIDQDKMESLFGLATHAPVRSANAPDDAAPASAAQFAARYINSGGDVPVAVISDDTIESLHWFEHLTEARCDRVNRLVRLAHVLQLSYAEADQLVCAAIDSEHRAIAMTGRSTTEPALSMTVNTIRAIGLFQELRGRYGCTAEDFAALLSDMSVFAIGSTPSQFDRVFNSGPGHPLKLDGEAFDDVSNPYDDKGGLEQLCGSLGVNMETLRYLARVIIQGQGTGRLYRNLPTVSAFYRLTTLARLLSITPIELLSLLEVLSPEGLYTLLLAGLPQNAMHQHYEQADSIGVIHAVSRCVRWCQEQAISISWLVQQLLPVQSNELVLGDTATMFAEIKAHLLPFQAFNLLLADAGVIALRQGDWRTALARLVDEQGLITNSGDVEEDFDALRYEYFAQREISVAVDQLLIIQEGESESPLPASTEDEVERLKALVLGVVLRIRSQQWGVVQERLSQFLSHNADGVISLVYWAGENVHTLLKTAVQFDPGQSQSEAMKAVMPFIYRLQRCTRVASRFALSPAMFASFLVREQQPRFSIKTTELTLHTLYFLERYAYCLRLGTQSEQHLLAYFALIEGVTEMSDTEAPLIRDAAAEKVAAWLGWGIREVLDVAATVSQDGIIRTMAQLCVLVRTRQVSDKTGLSAASLMKLSRLSAHDDVPSYRRAAEEMLSSLHRENAQARRDEAELRQSLSSRCQVSERRLVAQKAGEESTITLKLLDMNNQPVPRIKISWTSDLGTLLAGFSYTDEHGEATVRLAAGDVVGIAHVTAHYLLSSEAYAEPIAIDCHEDSLAMMPMESVPEEPWELSGNRGRYTLRAQLLDGYGNPGVDRLVIWASEIGSFIDSAGETLTDKDGYSTIHLRSLKAGEGIVAFKYVGELGDPAKVLVKFIDRPYLDSLLLISSTVVGVDIKVRATVLGLNGEPIAGQKVEWACTGATLLEAQSDSESDEQGRAHATLAATTAGRVEVTVKLLTADEPPLDYQFRILTFDALKDAKLSKIYESEHWPLADGISASEYEVHVHSSDGQPVARYPVTWAVQEEAADIDPVEVLTGLDGVARYELRSDELQTLTVEASHGDVLMHSFKPVTFMPPLGMEILLDGQRLDGVAIITPSKLAYELTYRLAADHPLLAEKTNLNYSGYPSAVSLGLAFSPVLGAAVEFKGREATWTITCEDTRLQQAVQIGLGFSHGNALPASWQRFQVKPAS